MTQEDALLALLLCSAVDHDRKAQDIHEGLKLNRTLQPLGSAHVNLLSNRTHYTTGQTDVGLRNQCSGRQDVFCHHNNTGQNHSTYYEGWNFNSGNYLFITDTK